MTTKKWADMPLLDLSSLDKAMSELEQALDELKAINYAQEQGPVEFDPNEPADYESKTHSY